MGNILQNIGRPDEAKQYFIAAESMAQRAQEASVDDEAEVASQDSTGGSALAGLRMFSCKVGDQINAALGDRNYVMECISGSPLLWVVHDLLSEEECDHIKSRSEDLLEKSYVMGGNAELLSNDSAAFRTEPYRSSHNAWLPPDDLLASLQLRLSKVSDQQLQCLANNCNNHCILVAAGSTPAISAAEE